MGLAKNISSSEARAVHLVHQGYPPRSDDTRCIWTHFVKPGHTLPSVSLPPSLPTDNREYNNNSIYLSSSIYAFVPATGAADYFVGHNL